MKEQAHVSVKLILAFAAVYIIWGSTYLAIRFAIETIPPFLMAGVRFLTAGVILFAFTYKKNKEPITGSHLKSTAIIGILLLLGGNGGVVWAEQFVPSGLTALLISTVPIWVVLITWTIPKEKNVSLKNVIGVILGFIGLFILVSPESIFKGESVHLIGAITLVGAALSWSIGSVYTKRAVLPKNSLTGTSLEMIFGGISLVIASLISGEWNNFNPAAVSMRSFTAVLYLIVMGSLIAFSAYIWLLEKAGPAKATTYAYVNPIVAVFLGWLLAGEALNPRIIFSAFIIVTAVVIIITNFSSFLSKKKQITPY